LEERTAALQAANAQLTRNIEALSQSEEALQERLRFETLLSDLSAQFIDRSSDQVGREIDDALRRVCEHLDLDLGVLWQWSEADPKSLTITHLHRPEGGPPLPERIDAQELFPWCLQGLLAEKVIVVNSVEELPMEAARDQETWRHYGIKSILALPLSAGRGPLLGVLGFNSMREERRWPEPIVRRLQLVAQVFANAIARKRA
jgi:GAF domain-containing protein